MTVPEIKQWLVDQLETATLAGGNEFTPGQFVEEIDARGGEDNEVIVVPSDGPTVSFHISIWGS